MGDVTRIIITRLGLGLLTLLVISVLIFGAVELLPGDIAQAVLGQGATEDNLRALRTELGLDRSAPVRYFDWLSGAIVGDFGLSLLTQSSVTDTIAPRFATPCSWQDTPRSSLFRSPSFSASSSPCCATRCSTVSPMSPP